MEPSNTLVICLGMGTVFFGLICLVAICKLTSLICGLFEKKEKEEEKSEVISNKQEILAAVCAAVAEEIGEEAKNIRVVSFKRV